MYCIHCGTALSAGLSFCTSCGEPIGKESPDNTGITAKGDDVQAEKRPGTSVEPPTENSSSPSDPAVIGTAEPVVNQSPPKPGKRGAIFFTALTAALLVVLAGGYFLFSSIFPGKQEAQNSDASLSSNSARNGSGENANETGISDVFEIRDVDTSGFPVVTLSVDIGNGNRDLYAKEDFSITEEGAPQTITEVTPSADQDERLIITYQAANLHKQPGTTDKRKLMIAFRGKQSESGYEVPQPLSLRMSEVSYNTDQYPEIRVYFSLYDSFGNLMENLDPEAGLFRLTENDKPVAITEAAKMGEVNESLSINVVMDNSNSMADRMDLVKQQARQFVGNISMTENDLIGFMSFAGASEMMQSDFTSNPEEIEPQINALNAEGQCTALYRAIDGAVHNTAYNGKTGSKYVVVFTDGQENCSNENIENRDYLNPQTVIHNANQLGVPVYAVGIEQDDQLEAITKGTNGDYISIGSDIGQLGQFYQSIFKKKKAQYIVKYRSDIAKKEPRTAALSLLNGKYFAKAGVTVTPKLIDDPEVARAMENYQINWSASMSSGDISYLQPYVTYDTTSKNAVYKIVNDQLIALNQAKANGSETTFSIPIYKLLDAKKVSDDLYQLQVTKYFKRTIYKNGALSDTAYKSTSYTYNVVKQNGVWLVDSTEETKVPETCYIDETYTKTTACK